MDATMLRRRWHHIERETRLKYHHWRDMWTRGNRKVEKKSKTAEVRTELVVEATSTPKEPHRRPPWPHTHGADPGLSLPACLFTVSVRRSSRGRSRASFLSFPPEIRNMIYQYAVLYPTSRTLFDAYYQQNKPLQVLEEPGNGQSISIRFQTPTILSLCKQITKEALSIMRTQTFVLDRLPPWVMGHDHTLPLTNFISKPTLQHLRYIEVRLSFGEGELGHAAIWILVMKELLNALSNDNHLVQLRIMIKLNKVMDLIAYFHELPYYDLLMRMLRDWEFHMSRGPGIVRLEHWVIDGDRAFSTGYRNPVVRFWPDPELWSGSVLEWL